MNTTRIFYFDGDIGDIADFTPAENKKEALKRFLSFKKIGKQELKYYDYTPFRNKIEDRKIIFNQLAPQIGKVLKPFSEVRFEFAPDKTVKDFFAFGTNSLFLFGTLEGKNLEIVTSIVFYKGYKQERSNEKNFDEKYFKQIAQLFCEIGEKYNLVLVDWVERKIIDLASPKDIERYLSESWH